MRKALLVMLVVMLVLLIPVYQTLPVQAAATPQIDLTTGYEWDSRPDEAHVIEMANLSYQELSALGSAVNKVLHNEWKAGKINRVALSRAQILAGEAESVGGLFSGPKGWFAKLLLKFGWIDVQPPKNVIEIPVESELTIHAIAWVGTESLMTLGPPGWVGALVVTVIEPFVKWGTKQAVTWQYLRDIGSFKVTKPGVGTLNVVYEKKIGEATIAIDFDDLREDELNKYGWKNEHLFMFVPFDKEPPNLKKTNGEFDYRVIFKSEAVPLAGRIIAIDAGHGGKDPGAPPDKLIKQYQLSEEWREKRVNLDVALRLEFLLSRSGAIPVLTRTPKHEELGVDLSPEERWSEAKRKNAELYISIHCNSVDSPTAGGTEAWYYPKNSAVAVSLADKIATHTALALGTRNRGAKYADPTDETGKRSYNVLRGAEIPAINVELAFISNPDENRKLADEAYRQKAAEAILSALLEHYAVFTPPATTPATPSPLPISLTKSLDIVLSIDRSGSMEGQKIRDAKSAASLFAGLLNPQDRIALVSFSTNATLDKSLTSDVKDAKTVIDGYSTGGNTNMGDALDKSIAELRDKGKRNAILSVIYFTDGVTNTGPSKREIIGTLVPKAVDAGVFIYTLGYGSDVDKDFLEQVATSTGGKYYFAPNRLKLLEIYTELSQKIRGVGKLAEFHGSVKQGETQRQTFLLKSTALFVKVFLIWPGSDLDLAVIDPRGNRLVPSPNVLYSGKNALPEYYEVYNPQPGRWTIEVYGKGVTRDAEDYTLMVFQPEALMHVKPTAWKLDYPNDREATITVSEIAGMVNLEGVVFAASDLAGKSGTIPAESLKFSPNNFTVRAGSQKYVKVTVNVPRDTPMGDYSGTIKVTGGNTAINTSVVVRVVSEDLPLPIASWWGVMGMIAVLVVLGWIILAITRREPVPVQLPQWPACPKCSTLNSSSARFCSSCGNDLQPTARAIEPAVPTCSRCGYENIPEAKFCQNCGASIPARNE